MDKHRDDRLGGLRLRRVCHGTGGRYDPATHLWAPVTLTRSSASRGGHTAVWASGEMLVRGGDTYEGLSNGNFSYFPPRPLYLYQKP